MFYFDIFMAVAFGIAYFRLGEIEYDRGSLVGSLSVLVWIGTRFGLGWGMAGSIGAQLGIFVALTVFNVCLGLMPGRAGGGEG